MRHAILVAALVLAGCAAGTRPSTVHPATADQVGHCTYIDDVTGTSGRYGVFAGSGAENARTDALQKAEAMGATHVVWQPVAAGYGGTSVNGKAYRCP